MDFEDKVRSGEYESKLHYADNKEAYRQDDARLRGLFFDNAADWLRSQGVPEQYAAKVVAYAYQEGHSHGYSEILNYLYGLIEIFEPAS